MNGDEIWRAETIVAEALAADEPRVGRFERTMAGVAVQALRDAGNADARTRRTMCHAPSGTR